MNHHARMLSAVSALLTVAGGPSGTHRTFDAGVADALVKAEVT